MSLLGQRTGEFADWCFNVAEKIERNREAMRGKKPASLQAWELFLASKKPLPKRGAPHRGRLLVEIGDSYVEYYVFDGPGYGTCVGFDGSTLGSRVSLESAIKKVKRGAWVEIDDPHKKPEPENQCETQNSAEFDLREENRRLKARIKYLESENVMLVANARNLL